MSTTTVPSNNNLEQVKPQTLPKNINKSISKIRKIVIDIISNIYAFFRVLIYGPRNTWKGFRKNIKKVSINRTNEKKLKLYQKYKVNQPKRNENEKVGYKVESQTVANNLQSKKNLDQYQLFEAKLSNEELKILNPFLDNLIDKKSANSSNILVSLKDLLENPNIPEDVKNILKNKLKDVAEFKDTKSQNVPLITPPTLNTPTIETPPDTSTIVDKPIVIDVKEIVDVDDMADPIEVQNTSTISMKKIAFTAIGVLSIAAMLYGFYYYSSEKSDKSISQNVNVPDKVFIPNEAFLNQFKAMSNTMKDCVLDINNKMSSFNISKLDTLKSNISNTANETFFNQSKEILVTMKDMVCDLVKNPFLNDKEYSKEALKLEPLLKDVDENVALRIWNIFFKNADAITQNVSFIPSFLQNFIKKT